MIVMRDRNSLTADTNIRYATRKKGLLWMALLMIMLTLMSCTPNSGSSINENDPNTPDSTVNEDSQNESVSTLPSDVRRRDLLNHVRSGGPPPDGIPPIEGGQYESVDAADEWLNDEDQVFLYETEDTVFLFPQRILVWHEIVNYKNDKHSFALTYCPLTGSAINYFYPDDLDTSFGTSGKLINSNLLMYDRATDAYISQIDGVGLNKDINGVVLNSTPVYWLDWSVARDSFKEALVLSTDTGFIRNYNQDPYGSYGSSGPTGYYLSEGLIFDPIYKDSEAIFRTKYSVIGIKYDDLSLALDPELVKKEGQYRFTLGDRSIQAVHDQRLDIVRLYYVPSETTLEIKDNQLLGNQGETWTLLGKRITASQDLVRPQYFEVMWFAWYAFYPETEVLK